MSEIIDVLIVLDEDGIKKQYPEASKDKTQPTPCDHKFIFMISSSQHVLSGNAGAEQKIKAQVQDNIRWRLTDIDPTTKKNMQLIEYVPTQGDKLIEEPEKLETGRGIIWEATVLKVGNVTYHWKFEVKNNDDTTFGYFTWDPFIEITP